MPGAGTNWHMAAGAPVRAAHHGEQQAGVPRVEDPAQHHREPALVLALPAHGHQRGQLLGQRPGSRRAGIVEGGRVAVLGDPVVGLAQALHVAAGQGEGLDPHHRLVAEVDVVHARVAVDGEPVLAGPHHRGDPAVAVGEPPEGTPHLLALVAGADGIGRDRGTPRRRRRRPPGCPGGRTTACRSAGRSSRGSRCRGGARCRGPGTRPPAPRSAGGRPPAGSGGTG